MPKFDPTTRLPLKKAVVVWWWDHYFDDSSRTIKGWVRVAGERPGMLRMSVGFPIHEDDDVLMLAGTVDSEDGTEKPTDVTTLFKSTIVRRQVLK